MMSGEVPRPRGLPPAVAVDVVAGLHAGCVHTVQALCRARLLTLTPPLPLSVIDRVLAAFVGQPLDTVRIRMQVLTLQPSPGASHPAADWHMGLCLCSQNRSCSAAQSIA